MTRPQAKGVTLTKVSKAIRLPGHPLSGKLRKMLERIDGVHKPLNLKALSVIMDRRITGGLFIIYADTGPYSIYLNPDGGHPELSLLHEVGHFLEWQCIPKSQNGPRDFSADPRFSVWLQAVYETQTVQRLLALLEEHEQNTQAFQDLDYLLSTNELWTRAYSQYVAGKIGFNIVSQQVSAENKVLTGTIKYQPYRSKRDFIPAQEVMDIMFTELGWTQ